MIKFEKVQFVDKENYSLTLEYNADNVSILIGIENGPYLTIPVSEWDDFIQKLQQAKELITPITDNESKNQ